MNRHKAGGVTQKNFKVTHFPSEGNTLSYIERAIQKGLTLVHLLKRAGAKAATTPLFARLIEN